MYSLIRSLCVRQRTSCCLFSEEFINASNVINNLQQQITITHPFSPNYGQVFALVRKTKGEGRNRLVCMDEAGNIRVFLASWTDYPSNDPYIALTEDSRFGNADFRFKDLDLLAKMLSTLKNV